MDIYYFLGFLNLYIHTHKDTHIYTNDQLAFTVDNILPEAIGYQQDTSMRCRISHLE